MSRRLRGKIKGVEGKGESSQGERRAIKQRERRVQMHPRCLSGVFRSSSKVGDLCTAELEEGSGEKKEKEKRADLE